MFTRCVTLILVCFWFCEANSELSTLDDQGGNVTETHEDPCTTSDILAWENEIRAEFENSDVEDSFVNATRRGGRRGRGRRKHPIMVKLRNKRGRRKLVSIEAELEYKIEIINKLQTKAEVLLIVDFLNKSDCGVGALFKEDSNAWEHLKSNDSSVCFSVHSSVEPRRRVMFPFHTPKCGCFKLRYHFGYREGNATIIRSPDPTSLKPHKKLTKTLCIQNEEDSEGEEGVIPLKKHKRRRGKKGFFKKNRRRDRKEKSFLRDKMRSSRLTLSRSKKDIFQIWDAQGRHATSNPSSIELNNKDNAIIPSENGHEYEVAENEILTDGIYSNDLPEEDKNEEHDEYEIENDNQSIEDEERNLVEDFEYEDVNENDGININDYEEDSEENDSEDDEVGNEVNYDENIDEDDDDESNESDEIENRQYDVTKIKIDDLSDKEIYDKELISPEEIDSNCDSDESDESSEGFEDDKEVINASTEVFETDETIIKRRTPINSINTVHHHRNQIRPRPKFRRKPYAIAFNNGMRHRNSFPRGRIHNFRNRRKQNPPFTRTSPFKPWKESNRAKWQRKHEINVNNIKASSICCRQGVNRKKLILHNKLENNSEFNKTCDEFPQKILSWVEKTFNVTEEFCSQKFSSCCEEWSLLSSSYRVPYYSKRREIFV